MGRVVIISGPPGAGKSTVARALADQSMFERTVHLHTDDFYAYLRKGYILPWKPQAHEQNMAASKAMAACAHSYAQSGYEVFVDGVVGPWLLAAWRDIASDGMEVHYAVLLPDLDETVSRSENRDKVIDRDVIIHMWKAFAGLGMYAGHVINTTTQGADETAKMVREMLEEGCLRLG